MSKRNELSSYVEQLHQRLRLRRSLRGSAVLFATALATTILLVLLLNAFAFPHRGLVGARVGLVMILFLTAVLGIGLPLLRLDRRRSVSSAEAACPEFQQRLLTFEEREKAGNDPFIELLAADTLAVAKYLPPASLVPENTLYALGGVGIACLGVLVWMIAAGPGYLGYGASLLWTGPKHNAAPMYDIHVAPGDVAVRRNSDQLITAQLIGLHTDKVRLYARYQSALVKFGKDGGWEPVAMQAGADGDFEFLFAGLPEDVEYYVQAGPISSHHFKVRVVDLPSVKQIQVTYHYPKWTGMKPVSEEQGGDLRAIEGTEAEIAVLMDRPLRDGLLVLDNGQQLHLTGGEGNLYKASLPVEKDGAYHVAAVDKGQQVRLSEDYFIAASKANPPEIAIERPGRDYRASPIEEVTIGVNAADDFGLKHVSFHYSVNGGPDQSVDMLKQPGTKNVNGTTTLSLEDFKLVPGDLVSMYATAADGHSEARTDITFIQADPFEREFSQSQQSGGGGGGGGGGGQNNQTDISKREKELIAETWKHQNDKNATAKDAADAGKFLSEVQTKLREQVLALSGRMQSRDLSEANEEFNSFEKDMQSAAAAMQPSSDKLKQMQWQQAIPNEQKALQYLLRAEATFRQIQVAFGQRGGGGGGGGGAGRDLASLFDLELDTERNQYETAQTGSAEEQRAKEIDDALQKLDALAKRQEELALQQHNSAQTFQERWQQEMLRREAEQLQRQMEQMAQNGQQGQQQQSQQGQQGGQQSSGEQSGQSSSSSSSGQASSSSSGQVSSEQGQSASGQNQSRSGQNQAGQSQQSQAGKSQAQSAANNSQSQSGENTKDDRVEQALNRLRQAGEEMKRSASSGTAPQQNQDAARRAADQLRQATNLLGGAQQQQSTGRLASLAGESDRLSKEEHAQAERIHTLANDARSGQDKSLTQEEYDARIQERDNLAEERQRLSDDLSQLEKGMRDTARELAPIQPGTASKLRDALNGMDQNDLTNRVQRTADWLRRGIDPNSNGTEGDIATDLQHLSDQVRQAQQSMGAEKPGQNAAQGQQIAALDHLERLRNQIQSQMRSQNQNQNAGQQGSSNNQQAQNGQPGQRGQNGQQAQGQNLGRQAGNGQGQNARGGDVGNRASGDVGNTVSGDIGNRGSGGGGEGAVWGNINTGNNHFGPRGQNSAAPETIPPPAVTERAYQNDLTELNQLRHLAQSDPAALKQVQELIRAMQQLDPHRFTGNPALVEQLHTQVLNDVDKLELQLRHDADDQSQGEVRTGKSSYVPPSYQDAVADYYRRLSNSGK